MKRLSIMSCAVIWALLAGSAYAQQLPPNGSMFSPSTPAPPPSPKIEVPVVPKMDAMPSQPRVRSSGRGSFSDRVSRCLDEGAAAGLDPADRSTYSRSCANRD